MSELIKILQVKAKETVDSKDDFNQVIVNNYQPGQGISRHIDAKLFGPLGGGGTMRFRKAEQTVDISIYLMTDEAQYGWTLKPI